MFYDPNDSEGYFLYRISSEHSFREKYTALLASHICPNWPHCNLQAAVRLAIRKPPCEERFLKAVSTCNSRHMQNYHVGLKSGSLTYYPHDMHGYSLNSVDLWPIRLCLINLQVNSTINQFFLFSSMIDICRKIYALKLPC